MTVGLPELDAQVSALPALEQELTGRPKVAA